MINHEEKVEFLNSVLHGQRYGFDTCKLIREALSYKGRIPKSFWSDEDKAAYGIMGLHDVSKTGIRQLRNELIFLIAERISNQKQTNHGDEITTDHYARYFHALAILGVPKDTIQVPAIGTNLKYNAAYSLWVLDDGSDKVWEAIDDAMWYTSEAIKNDGIENACLTGRRHQCN